MAVVLEREPEPLGSSAHGQSQCKQSYSTDMLVEESGMFQVT
jgi:hypothetical protein